MLYRQQRWAPAAKAPGPSASAGHDVVPLIAHAYCRPGNIALGLHYMVYADKCSLSILASLNFSLLQLGRCEKGMLVLPS